MAIDFTRKETLITVKIALIRALNSLDNEIAETKQFTRHTAAQIEVKLDKLNKSRADMTVIYNEIDSAINAAH